jgi:hypothetical protein
MDEVLKKALVIDDPARLFRNPVVDTQPKDETPGFPDKVEDVPATEILPQ